MYEDNLMELQNTLMSYLTLIIAFSEGWFSYLLEVNLDVIKELS